MWITLKTELEAALPVMLVALMVVVLVQQLLLRRRGALSESRQREAARQTEERGRYLNALIEDITDRRRAERQLRESEERFRRLAEASFEGIVVLEGDEIIDANELYAGMLGRAPPQVIGRPIDELIVPEERPAVMERIRRGDERAFEHGLLRADGTRLTVEVRCRTATAAGGAVRVVAVRDVTEHKRFEREIQQAQKMEAVGRLAGGIAHDFNNLLTVIQGYGQLLERELEPGPLRDQAEAIHRATAQASLMTQQLLAFGRQQPPQPMLLDLNKVLAATEKLLRRLVRADIEVRVRAGDGLGKIKADPGQIQQVILNLTINAVDAMPQGGVLSLDTLDSSLDTDRPQRPPSLPPGAYVLLRVRDTGTGMDPETLSRVFEPFFTTKEGKGTGLGLATVYGIVNQNGGRIAIDSTPGEGTAFSIYLPRVIEPVDAAKKHPARQAPRGSETVLVVEDEAGVRRLTVDLLRHHGYHVLEAADGRRALAEVERYSGDIHLILTDVVMPDLNGPQMIRRAVARRPRVKVLYMSGYADDVLYRAGPAEDTVILQKPFSVEELAQRVRETLDGARATAG